MSQRIIPLRDLEEERALFGSLDRNLHLLRRLYKVDAVSRGGVLKLSGAPQALEDSGRVVEKALDRIRSGRRVDGDEVERIFRTGGNEEDESEGGEDGLRLLVEPRTENQARYLKAIQEGVLTFGIGPAGTGKSFLAVAMAVAYLKANQYRRIVLCRPAVEAGESLGFLPGDLASKINPYLRPLYDALHSMLPRAQVKRYLEEEVIEILPLAYMRGRTLNHSVIILDEAQNCTNTQMKMALTRLGQSSKMIVTGDITQIDLPQSKASGLMTARRILGGVKEIEFVYLSKSDIVRHPVVAEIVRAYTKEEEGARSGAKDRLLGAGAGRDAGAGEESRRRPGGSRDRGDARRRGGGRKG